MQYSLKMLTVLILESLNPEPLTTLTSLVLTLNPNP